MKIITYLLPLVLVLSSIQNSFGQETTNQQIELLTSQKGEIVEQEKNALKKEVESISQRLKKEEINDDEAKHLKELAAKKRALNIENRISIIENKILLVQRNGSQVLKLDTLNYASQLQIGFGKEQADGERILGMRLRKNKNRFLPNYDLRTTSNLVLAAGLNNAITYGESFNESPYKFLGGRFFEIGYAWQTRVFKKSNWLRFKYGLSFQFNGLKPTKNRYFAAQADENGIVRMELTEYLPREGDLFYGLKKSKYRMDNFVFPMHLEFGPSDKKVNGKFVRYNTSKSFKFGVGGYVGYNFNNVQKVLITKNGQLLTSVGENKTPIFGLSSYLGIGECSLYLKYDLTQIFPGPSTKLNNISLGLRFDL